MKETTRCAIYTRKSSRDGLDQDFNSLDAQREACAACIASQRHEGWVLLPGRYDDGGISGGTLERPGLARLLDDVDAGLVDMVVIYKIDRLTRSLTDFAQLVERLDAAGTSFVSVTQSFNTATSMGRLTLNMLLSFAQFEREVTAERIRDKIAASKRKGLWMGGLPPMGYRPDGRTLVIDEQEAHTIRTLYDLYLEYRTIPAVRDAAEVLGLRSRCRHHADGQITGGGVMGRGHIHHILTNPVYAGRIRHRGETHDGQHPAIIEPATWQRVQDLLQESAARVRGATYRTRLSPLSGRLFDETGDRLTPSHSRKKGRRYRYYISRRLTVDRSARHPDAWRLPAGPLERQIGDVLRKHLGTPRRIADLCPGLAAAELEKAIQTLQARLETVDTPEILNLLERADLNPGTLHIRLAGAVLADWLGLPVDTVASGALTVTVPFRMRRRGVERKLVIGAEDRPEIDRRLVTALVTGRQWLEDIIAGRGFGEIARRDRTTTRRVRRLARLALLSPDVMTSIARGTQPTGMTADYLVKTGVPASWEEQAALVAALRNRDNAD